MDFIGKVIFIGQARSGTSSSGKPWASQEFVIENSSARYPSKLCFTVFGQERIRQFNIQMGETLSVSFDIDAHEFNGRWYNNISAFAVARVTTVATVQTVPVPPSFPPTAMTPAPETELPF